jgi:hypothetical protein
MSLPKRVPWETLAELDELCSWIYGDQTDTSFKQLAKNRVRNWLFYPVSYRLIKISALRVASKHPAATRSGVSP